MVEKKKKKINKTQKGSRHELYIRKELEKAGWMVDFKPKVRFQKNQDIFNLWDFIAIDRDQIMFGQVKSTMSHVSEFKRKSKDFLEKINFGKEVIFVIYLVQTGKKVRMFYYNNEDWKELE